MPPIRNDQAETNIFEQIDSICESFRQQWKHGKRPEIEPLLEQVEPRSRNLFRNLLHIDIEFRRRAKLNPTSQEYANRFPEFARLIRQAFYESTMMSMDALRNTSRDSVSNDAPTMDFAVPFANRLGEYQLLSELGRGGFGVVYKARHNQTQNLVALKTLPVGGNSDRQYDAERLHKFRREFRSLGDVNHPNLIGMQTLEVDGSQWFFTMDLIEGIDLLSYVRPNGDCDEKRLRATLPQLASGIMALHGQHIVHRDLKPGNVMVTPDGHVLILDFGLVVELNQRMVDHTASFQSQQFAGTVPYAAPEQTTGNQTAASDWYSFGVILYEALCGERPFQGPVIEIITRKQNEDPPRLSDREDLPRDLADLADQLLARDPNERPNALAIAKALSVDNVGGSQPINDQPKHNSSGDSRELLIDRETQLARLEHFLNQVRAEHIARTVFISGRSGEGKTSLAEKFLSPLRLDTEILVFSGRCYDRESVPFKAIDSVIDALVGYLRGRSEEKVKQVLPADTHMLSHLFPLLRRVEAINSLSLSGLSGLDSKQIQHRAFGALRELLRQISQTTPIVIFIDDLQWGDAASATVLHRLLSPPNAPTVLFLGSYRSDEADDSPFVTTWEGLDRESEVSQPETEIIKVGPLNEQQCVSLVLMRLGQDTPQIRIHAKELFHSTGGNPYFLDQLIDCFDPDTGAFQTAPLNEVIDQRLLKLPDDATSLLRVIAVSGQALSIGEAAQAIGGDEAAYSTVTRMRKERLVRMIGSDEQQMVDTYHDKIRETVLENMDDQTRRGLHCQIGETIERADGVLFESLQEWLEEESDEDSSQTLPVRVFDLSYHFDAAGESNKALVYSVLAAEKAKSQYALDNAHDQYEIAERSSMECSRKLRYRIKLGHGETLLLSGQYEGAGGLLEKAKANASNQRERLTVDARLADVIYKSKSITESIDAIEDILRELKAKVPQTRFGLLFDMLRMEVTQRAFAFLPRQIFKTAPDPSWKTVLATQSNLQLLYPNFFNDSLKAAWSTFKASSRSQRHRSSPEIQGLCMTHMGILFSTILGFPANRGIRNFKNALEIAKSADNVTLEATVRYFYGWGLGSYGRFEEAVEMASEGHRLYQKIGDAWRVTFTNNVIAWDYSRLGQCELAVKHAREAFEQSILLGQFRLAQSALEPWAVATSGDLPFAELASCIQPVTNDLTTTVEFKTAEYWWHSHHERTDDALRLAEEAVTILRSHWIMNDRSINAIPNLARALRRHADVVEFEDKSDASHLRKKGFRIAKLAVRRGRWLKCVLPYAWRELAFAYEAYGRPRKALKYARKSLELADQQNAKHQFAQSLLLCGHLGQQLDRPNSHQQIQEAENLLAEYDRKVEETNEAIFGGTD